MPAPNHRPRALIGAVRSACALMGMALSAAPSLAASSVGGGAWAQADVTTYDPVYHYGIPVPSGGAPICYPVNCGPGHVTAPGALYASADMDTAYGAISGQVAATAFVPNFNQLDTKAMVDGQWQDHFSLGSDTLPAGTPVTVMLTLKMNASTAHGSINMADPGAPSAFAGMGLGRDYLQVGLGANPAALDQVSTATLTFVVGSSFDLTGLMVLRSQGYGNNNMQAASWQSAQASAQYFVDLLTPGAFYTTDSGHDYTTSAVPEPAPALLLLAGLLAVAQRKASARAASVTSSGPR